MSDQPSTIERAYQLGRSGDYADVQKVIKALKAEGYEAVEAHMQGSLRKEIAAACRASWKGEPPRKRGSTPR